MMKRYTSLDVEEWLVSVDPKGGEVSLTLLTPFEKGLIINKSISPSLFYAWCWLRSQCIKKGLAFPDISVLFYRCDTGGKTPYEVAADYFNEKYENFNLCI